MTALNQSKEINIDLVGSWRGASGKKVHNKMPFFIPVVDELQALFYTGRLDSLQTQLLRCGG